MGRNVHRYTDTRPIASYQFVLTRVAGRNRTAFDYDVIIERREVEAQANVSGKWTHVRRGTGSLEVSEQEDVAVRLSIAPHRERVFQYRFRVEHTPSRPFLKTIIRGPDGNVATSEGRDGWVESSVGVPTRGRKSYQVVLTRVASRNKTAFNYDFVIERREVGAQSLETRRALAHCARKRE